jgi:tetratricopeptide (TPR) repeat protein
VLALLLGAVGVLHGQSPLDELIVTIPKVDKNADDVRTDPRNEAGTFIAPEISLSPGNTLNPENLIEIREDAVVRSLLEDGASNLASNQVYEATRYYWRAARRDPVNREALAGLAACYLLANDGERAVQLYENLVAEYPVEEEYTFNLASAHYKLMNYEAALAILQKLHKQHPQDAKILYNLALNHLAGGEKATGIRYMERSFALLPENPFPLLALARTYSRDGNRVKMIESLENAAKLLTTAELELYLKDPAFAHWPDEGLFEKILAGSL